MIIKTTIRLSLRGMNKFTSILERGLSPSGSGPADKFLKRVGARYLTFVRKRFLSYSRGGGNWPPLKHKRKKGAKTRASVLYDTGTLFNALTIGLPGNLFKRIKNGIRVGFGGPAKHPDGTYTIRQIAEVHQQGSTKKNIPKREIIVEPTKEIHAAIQRELKKAMDEIGRRL